MPRENCAFTKCSTSRKGISSFKIPTPDETNDESIKWTKDLIDIILKHRVKDQSLIRLMQSYKLYICERHFTPDLMYIHPKRKLLKEGTLPTLNLPRESVAVKQNLALQTQLKNAENTNFFKTKWHNPQKCL